MKTKKILLVVFILSQISIAVNAQTDVDALRYSGSSVTGTSRFTSMAGAFGALGGDFTSLSYNPAGIAIYRTSEFTFTPSVYVGSTTSYFQGKAFDDRRYNFNFGNVGLVYTRKLTNDVTSAGWKSWNFGIGYNRLNNFHSRNFYEGKNISNSLLDLFVENANHVAPEDLDPFYESLAYNTYLLNPDNSNNYTSVIPFAGEIQKRTTETRGAIGETVFSFGGNYSNKLYLGATLGLKSLRYVETSTYEENDPDTTIPYFTSFRLQQDLTTRGNGFDFKVGMIYKVSDVFRFGFAIETPTWYAMHDDYNNRMMSKIDSGTVQTFNADAVGAFDYDLTTPFKAMGSVAFVFGKLGLLSADYQFSDYSAASFGASGTSFSDINSIISDKYSIVHTVRLGTEWRIENISLRGGFSYLSSPMDEKFRMGTSDFSKKNFSGGIGFRNDDLFIDFGYVYIV